MIFHGGGEPNERKTAGRTATTPTPISSLATNNSSSAGRRCLRRRPGREATADSKQRARQQLILGGDGGDRLKAVSQWLNNALKEKAVLAAIGNGGGQQLASANQRKKTMAAVLSYVGEKERDCRHE